MYVVMTRVKLRPGMHEKCAKIFEDTNPALVAEEADWLGARMMFEREAQIVTVLATWRNAQSYRDFSARPDFQNTMRQFGELFAGPPQVTINEVLVEMGSERV